MIIHQLERCKNMAHVPDRVKTQPRIISRIQRFRIPAAPLATESSSPERFPSHYLRLSEKVGVLARRTPVKTAARGDEQKKCSG